MNAPVAGTPPATEPPPCLIVNPASFRASGARLAEQAVLLATAYGADVLEATGPADLAGGLDRQLAKGSKRFFVLAGDGTVQAIADHLARLPSPHTRAQLLVLAGGRTNLTAADVGGDGAVIQKLQRALVRWRNGGTFQQQERITLRIEQAPAPSRQGFFVAGAIVDGAIREMHRYREGGGLRGSHLGTAWFVLALAFRGLLGRSRIGSIPLEVNAGGSGRLTGSTRLLIATTLLHRRGLFNPYADRGKGLLRVTAVRQDAVGFWRRLPRLLLGRFSARMNPEHGYLSGRCERLEVHGLPGYTLDGEKFDTDPSRPVVIRPGARIAFLLP